MIILNDLLLQYNLAMYNVNSSKAEEFIDDNEIQETLLYAAEHKSDRVLIQSLLEKASLCKGL